MVYGFFNFIKDRKNKTFIYLRVLNFFALLFLTKALSLNLFIATYSLVLFEIYALIFLILPKMILSQTNKILALCIINLKYLFLLFVLYELLRLEKDISFVMGLISFVSFFIILAVVKRIDECHTLLGLI